MFESEWVGRVYQSNVFSEDENFVKKVQASW